MNTAAPLSMRLLWFLVAVPLFAGSPDGIKNFHQVDEHVYRGAQPDHKGFTGLAQLGIKTVIDLRESGHRSSDEEAAVNAAGMKYVNVPMSGLTAPSELEMKKLLSILEDESSGPVFVHCMRGADRTGAVIAAYRIHHARWDNARALTEAESLGMSIFQFPRKSFIRSFQGPQVEAKASTSAETPTPALSAAPVTAR